MFLSLASLLGVRSDVIAVLDVLLGRKSDVIGSFK